MALKTYCIQIHGVRHEMKLMQSDCPGYYMYNLIPMELGYEPKVIYIAPERTAHYLYGKPMQGGKQIDTKDILYFHTYK